MGIAALKAAVTDDSSMKEPEIASIKVGEKFHVYSAEEVSKYLN